MRIGHVFQSWGRILRGDTPLLSIEITRECPLHCPGCYAYGNNHLGGEVNLRDLGDKRGDDLVCSVLELVDRYQPLQVTLVGGEPMVRHRELNRILPELAARGIFSMVVTSGIIEIPLAWMNLHRFTAAVSIDGLPEDHDVRRHPATYERIMKNIAGRRINVHWTITAPMLRRAGYLEEYVRLWSERPEVQFIWVSLYSPQRGEQSAERLSPEQRAWIARELPRLRRIYSKLLTPEGYVQALLHPPGSPRDCTFSRLSTNLSADLVTRVEPCVFGGEPDCSQCGCSISAAAHSIAEHRIAGPMRAKHLLHPSMRIGAAAARLRQATSPSWRTRERTGSGSPGELVQITSPGNRIGAKSS